MKTENREPGTENRKKRGMSSMEYIALVGAIVLALVAIQVTLRRAISSRWRDVADSTFGSGRQYDPALSTVK